MSEDPARSCVYTIHWPSADHDGEYSILIEAPAWGARTRSDLPSVSAIMIWLSGTEKRLKRTLCLGSCAKDAAAQQKKATNGRIGEISLRGSSYSIPIFEGCRPAGPRNILPGPGV